MDQIVVYHNALVPAWEKLGERVGLVSLGSAITLKTLTFIQIAEVSNILTFILTGISVVYMLFKTINEIKIFRRNKGNNN